MDRNRLELTPDEMRDFGYQVVDILVEHFYSLPDKPTGKTASRPALEKLIEMPVPTKGESYDAVLQDVLQHVTDNVMHLDHPRFFAWVPSPSNFVSVMGDLLASGFNVFSGLWLAGAGAAQVELTTLHWLIQLMGMPQESGGLFVSGGSVANLTGLTVAKHIKLNNAIEQAVVYFSDQTHASVERALKILNFAPHQLVKIPTDTHYRLNTKHLKRQILKDRKLHKRPFCIIANAGTTNTGAIDPLEEIHEICKQEDLWMHVDGAYGAAGMLSQEGQQLLKGLSHADSLTLDPHKWLFQPYEIGCLLVKEKEWLTRTFENRPTYLRDTQQKEEYNFSNTGIQLTRSFRALKLWMSIRVFGIDAFKDAVGHGLYLAKVAEKKIRQLPDWEVITPAQLGIITFRFSPASNSEKENDQINKKIVASMIREQYAMLSSTILDQKTVLRMCIINPRTTIEDVEHTISKLSEIGQKISLKKKIIV